MTQHNDHVAREQAGRTGWPVDTCRAIQSYSNPRKGRTMNGNNGYPQSEGDAVRAMEDARANIQEDDYRDMANEEADRDHQDEQMEREDAYILDYLKNFRVKAITADGVKFSPSWPLEPMSVALQEADEQDNERMFNALQDRDLRKVQMMMFDVVMEHFRTLHRAEEL